MMEGGKWKAEGSRKKNEAGRRIELGSGRKNKRKKEEGARMMEKREGGRKVEAGVRKRDKRNLDQRKRTERRRKDGRKNEREEG